MVTSILSPSDLRKIPETFMVLEDTCPEDTSLPAFMVSTTRGFLPRANPVVTLPPEFAPLESLLQRMPIRTADVTPGLLATGSLGHAIDVEHQLPNLVEHVAKYKDNLPLINALYRDYSFVASAYLLEPCHLRWMAGRREEVVKGKDGEPDETVVKGGEYELGREELPECISVPIAEVAKLTGFQPFMEYAGAYALFNYKLIDPTKPLACDNISPIRAFEHGLDPTSSEAGFVLVHVDMVKESGPLVKHSLGVLDGCAIQDRKKVNEGLSGVRSTLQKVNKVMDSMWNKSKPKDYNNFRTFIFGITSQSMFPRGVIYRGVSDTPLSFRGESGANDSMIPLVDNLLQIRMPDTPLTEILHDFRKYRPGNHREFLEWVWARAEASGVRDFCCRRIEADKEDGVHMGEQTREMEEIEEMRKSAVWYLLCLDQIREFRWRHWCFTREYILKKSFHPTATGGSPIVTWLPNQLNAVLAMMSEVLDIIDSYTALIGPLKRRDEEEVKRAGEVESAREIMQRQTNTLKKEVERYCAERGMGPATVPIVIQDPGTGDGVARVGVGKVDAAGA